MIKSIILRITSFNESKKFFIGSDFFGGIRIIEIPNNIAKNITSYRILVFSKFDRSDPSYQTSKKREFDRLEKIWQFYQPSSCLSKKKRLFLLILRDKTLFFFKKKRSKSTRQTHFLKMSQTSFI